MLAAVGVWEVLPPAAVLSAGGNWNSFRPAVAGAETGVLAGVVGCGGMAQKKGCRAAEADMSEHGLVSSSCELSHKQWQVRWVRRLGLWAVGAQHRRKAVGQQERRWGCAGQSAAVVSCHSSIAVLDPTCTVSTSGRFIKN